MTQSKRVRGPIFLFGPFIVCLKQAIHQNAPLAASDGKVTVVGLTKCTPPEQLLFWIPREMSRFPNETCEQAKLVRLHLN